MVPNEFRSLKLAIVTYSGLPKDALHIYVGLAVFLAASVVWRRRSGLPIPWLIVLAVAVAGEALDRCDDINTIGHWDWRASVHDLWNTLLWPTVLFVLLRFGLLGKCAKR